MAVRRYSRTAMSLLVGLERVGDVAAHNMEREHQESGALSFVSYAQNLEDVILWRALKDVRSGFYVDVGAYDPVEHSVTKAFYDRGWRGISIEPATAQFQRLSEARPDDINLNTVIADKAGTSVFYEIPGTGLSTVSLQQAKEHESKGWPFQRRVLPCLRLTDVLAAHGKSQIHFLKIDVEGAEFDVLRGLDFSQYRPWIVIVEATQPLSEVRVDAEWRPLLERNSYDAVYFDGLNLFFLAREHSDLKPRFSAPPNIFDDYRTYSELRSQEELAEISRRLSLAEAEHAKMAARASEERAKGNDELVRLAAALEVTRRRTHELELELATSRAHQDMDRILDEMRGPLARQTQALQRLEHALERRKWRPFDSLAKPFRKARTVGLIALVPRPLRRLLPSRVHSALIGTNSSAASSDDAHRRSGLIRFLHRMRNSISKQFRKLAQRDLRTAHQSKRLLIDQLDLSAEPESVRRLYLRLVQARERLSRSGDRV